MPTLAKIIVILAGMYLVGLGITAFAARERAANFLLGFVKTPFRHYLEMALRLLVGAALVVNAPQMNWPIVFALFGWVLVSTTIVLLLLPWRWHQRFATAVVPPVVRQLSLIGIVSIVFGAIVLFATLGAS